MPAPISASFSAPSKISTSISEYCDKEAVMTGRLICRKDDGISETHLQQWGHRCLLHCAPIRKWEPWRAQETVPYCYAKLCSRSHGESRRENPGRKYQSSEADSSAIRKPKVRKDATRTASETKCILKHFLGVAISADLRVQIAWTSCWELETWSHKETKSAMCTIYVPRLSRFQVLRINFQKSD